MRKTIVIATLAAALIGGGGVTQADAQLAPFGVDSSLRTNVDLLQFLFGGRQYCWYDGGWRGPGWYWCGYAYRNGYGWGGGEGWQGHSHLGGGDRSGRRVGGASHAGGRGAHPSGGHAGGGRVGGSSHAGGGHPGGNGGGRTGGGGGHPGGGHAGGGGGDKKGH